MSDAQRIDPVLVEKVTKVLMKGDVMRPRTDSGLGGLRPMTWLELSDGDRDQYREPAEAVIVLSWMS